jgi:hypothetical protein
MEGRPTPLRGRAGLGLWGTHLLGLHEIQRRGGRVPPTPNRIGRPSRGHGGEQALHAPVGRYGKAAPKQLTPGSRDLPRCSVLLLVSNADIHSPWKPRRAISSSCQDADQICAGEAGASPVPRSREVSGRQGLTRQQTTQP